MLRPYQSAMYDHAAEHVRAAWWAGMGLGKTLTALTLVDALTLCESEPALVLGPLRVVNSTWPDEVAKWKHLRNLEISTVTGTPKQRIAALAKPASVYASNYENLPWLIEHLGDAWPFGTVIADESTRLKGFRGAFQTHHESGKVFYRGGGGQRVRALGRIAHTKVRRWLNLTGTPAPNGLEDLWGQSWFLDGGQRLGQNFGAFRDRWFESYTTPDGYTKSKPRSYAQSEITAKLRDLCLTVDSRDHFPDLPELVVNSVRIELPPAARRIYDGLEKEFFATLECGTAVEAFNSAARSQKLRQAANGAIYIDPAVGDDDHPRSKQWREIHTAKLEALESIVEECAGEPLLVAYDLRSDRERILKTFKRARFLDHDPQTVRDWNAGKIPMLVAHPKSAGHGLNMQDGGRHLAVFGHDWDLELFEQIVERIGPVRQVQAGHPRTVFIHNVIATGTIDEELVERRATKATVQDAIRAAMKRRAA